MIKANHYHKIISVTILLLLIIDLLGNLLLFIFLIKYLNLNHRQVVLVRETVIALKPMLIFCFLASLFSHSVTLLLKLSLFFLV
ncbi:MAG: MarC family protein [Candidatus Malihini olakiniferum]